MSSTGPIRVLFMSSPTSVCPPGYKHVESFSNDNDYESGEEVSYVTLDLGDVEPQLVPSATTYHLIVRIPLMKD